MRYSTTVETIGEFHVWSSYLYTFRCMDSISFPGYPDKERIQEKENNRNYPLILFRYSALLRDNSLGFSRTENQRDRL